MTTAYIKRKWKTWLQKSPPIITAHAFFSVVYGIFSEIRHLLGNEGNCNKYRETETILCILSDDKYNTNKQRETSEQAQAWR